MTDKNTSIVRHYLRYFNANMAIVIAGFISFPILSRLLSKHDFGILGYFQSIQLLLEAVLKLGIQHSILRFYSTFCLKEGSQHSNPRFYATLVLIPSIVSLCISAILILSLYFYQKNNVIENANYLYLIIILAQMATFTSLIRSVMQAQELSRHVTSVDVFFRFFQLVLVFLILYFLSQSALSVFISYFIAYFVILIFLCRWFIKNCSCNIQDFNPEILKQNFSYGIPLMFNEMAMLILAFADRIMLKEISDDFSSVGIYTIGYGLAMYLGVITGKTILSAFAPTANRLYETEGIIAVKRLQKKILGVLLYIIIFGCITLYFIGGDVLIIIAGSDKHESAIVFQYIGFVYLAQGFAYIAFIGLTLSRRTKILLLTVTLAITVNIILNLILIPLYEVMGAVYATIISYIVMWFGQLILCPQGYKPEMSNRDIFIPVLLGVILIGICLFFNIFSIESQLWRIFIFLNISLFSFIIPALVINRNDFKIIIAKVSK